MARFDGWQGTWYIKSKGTYITRRLATSKVVLYCVLLGLTDGIFDSISLDIIRLGVLLGTELLY